MTKLIEERIEQPDLSKEEKEHLKAQTEAALQGLFHTYPWEAKYAKSLMREDDNPSLIKKLANLSRHSTSKPRPKPGVKGEDNSLVE